LPVIAAAHGMMMAAQLLAPRTTTSVESDAFVSHNSYRGAQRPAIWALIRTIGELFDARAEIRRNLYVDEPNSSNHFFDWPSS
jgi:hypothetical protein